MLVVFFATRQRGSGEVDCSGCVAAAAASAAALAVASVVASAVASVVASAAAAAWAAAWAAASAMALNKTKNQHSPTSTTSKQGKAEAVKYPTTHRNG